MILSAASNSLLLTNKQISSKNFLFVEPEDLTHSWKHLPTAAADTDVETR